MSGYWPDKSRSGRIAQNTGQIQTGFVENFMAAREDQKANNNPFSRYDALSKAYSDRIAQIESATGKKLKHPILSEAPSLVNDAILGRTESSRRKAIDDFEAEVDLLRQEHPALPTRDQMIAQMNDRARRIEGDAADQYDRANFAGKVGSIIGAMEGAIEDPALLATMPFGAARSAGVVATAVTEGVIAGGTELATQPQIQQFRGEQGLEAGVLEGAKNIAAATGGAAALGGVAKGAAEGVMLLSGKRRLKLFDKIVKKPTPEQKAARDFYERQLDVEKDNPFDSSVPGAAQEHSRRLADAMRALDGEEEFAPVHTDLPKKERSLRREMKSLDGVIHAFDPDDVQVDAKTFQFKDGGDAQGVTERLRGVGQWDPDKAGLIFVYEYEDGRRFIADGHQRLGLAKRLKAESSDEKLEIYGMVMRESDGVTPEDARMRAAMTNIAQGTGTAVDAAKVLRVAPERIGELPPHSALVRQAGDMVSLSDDAFGMVVNEIVPANYAALVGRIIPDDADLQLAVMDVLSKTAPANVTQAESIVRQAASSGVRREVQQGLFGEEIMTQSLFSERAKVLDKTLKKLRRDKNIFDSLVRNENSIAAEGNVLNTTANRQIADAAAVGADMVQRLANRKGPLSDALTLAARRAADEGQYTNATDDFVRAVRDAIERGDFTRIQDGGAGRAVQVADENAPRAGETAEPDEQSLNLFDKPGQSGSEQQARALDADVRSDAVTDSSSAEDDFQIPVGEKIDPDTGERVPETRSAKDILDELDRDEAELGEIGKCGKP